MESHYSVEGDVVKAEVISVFQIFDHENGLDADVAKRKSDAF